MSNATVSRTRSWADVGQLLHFFESANRFGLPAFYTLHVWAWKDNPAGAFSNWHSQVSGAALTPQN